MNITYFMVLQNYTKTSHNKIEYYPLESTFVHNLLYNL